MDLLLSLALCAMMLFSTLRMLRESIQIPMNAVPESIDLQQVTATLREAPGVLDVHDLHVWSIGDANHALAAHVQIADLLRWPQMLQQLRDLVAERHGITHLTLQPEQELAGDAGSASESPQAAGPARDDRMRAERDQAIADALAMEQQRDASREVALRFEREFDDERRTLARELRDELSGQAMQIKTLAATLDNRLAGREPSLAHLARLVAQSTDELFAAVRSITTRLRPHPLEHGGLLEGLRMLVADWQLKKPAIRFELLIEPADDERFGLGDPEIEAAAWHIASDAIGNAIAHAGARTVVVSVRRGSDTLTLQVIDDGCGLAGGDQPEGAGLAAMRERAARCSGSVTVGTGEAGGVEVLVMLPWPGAATV